MRPPEIVVHADWSVDPAKRWCARAIRLASGEYAALAPEPVGSLEDFLPGLQAAAGPGGTVFAGFDFPLGLPSAYADAAKIDDFAAALIAFGRGEWLGVGLGASVEKLFYLPEAHTDFLLAVIAEELGLVGVAVVIGLFVCVVLRAFTIGRQAALRERHFSALAAQGIGAWIGVQALINMGVNTGLLPTKGLTLPLMSFGGTGLLVNFVALAILLRIDWENRQLARGMVV